MSRRAELGVGTDAEGMTARHRPRGALRHALGLMTPSMMAAAKMTLERDAGLRARRLGAAALDRVREQRRPTRPRMRALTIAPAGRIEWREVPAPPPPGPDAAVVHPIAIATCDLDRAMALGVAPFPLPLHFGHECVAEVLSIGDRVTNVRPGQRVVVPFQISCGSCRPCDAGHTSNCASVPPVSMYGFGVGGGHWGGAVSDQLLVPFADAMLVALPEGIDPAAAASVADNVSDGYRHVGPYVEDLLARDPDAEVLIISSIKRRPVLGPSVLLYAGLVARALGVRSVHFADSRASVRQHAEELGLTSLRPHQLRRQALAPLVVDGSGTPAGLKVALERTAPDGICSSAASFHRVNRIPGVLLYGRNVTYRLARAHTRILIPKVLDLMVTRQLQPEKVTTRLERLDDAPRALKCHVFGDVTKTVLVE